ncbi:TIGR04282 family arsenosugar biosynthesis glycosyltransferase [Croceiramulus getboli]|nr:DUF2064 domain-containing protein [Flavobacteriaceae bacterium YJPT1-3]
MSAKTAILLFAQSAEEEVKYKPFQRAKPLFEALNEQALKVVQSTKLPYFWITEAEQEGNHFGERFTQALSHVFDQGYDQVIAIGNDCPHLTANHLLQGKDALDQKQVVIGPSGDGGFYLLGINREVFNPAQYAQLPWQTAGLSRALLQLLSKTGQPVAFLEQLWDLDGPQDVQDILQAVKPLAQKMRSLLKCLARKVLLQDSASVKLAAKGTYSFPFSRGSPVLIST